MLTVTCSDSGRSMTKEALHEGMHPFNGCQRSLQGRLR